ncbi:hypothetical protein [Solidesulfovibrio alcoholivorans]|uniref:hypothetical protein n=1 Tax=Solidesulfovibrio alcoholivorans TaxID=81406 RepID=UPI0004979BE8|nr:hypothetical protein [Solidesulfovibrio alcoholivorans]
MTKDPNARASAALPLCCLVCALWAVHALLLGNLAFTGDEVRYVAYGLGLFHGQGFHPSDALWREMLAATDVLSPLAESPAGHAGRLIHSVVYPVLGSPALFFAGLDGARWLSFAVGAAGLCVLYAALVRRFSRQASLAAVAAVAFACPVLLYLRLFFAEILLFTVNALVLLFFVSDARREPGNAVPAVFGLCLLPFVHVKLSLEAAIACAIVFFTLRPRLSLARQCAMGLVAALMFGLFLLYNSTLFGAAIGGGNPAFPVTLAAVPDRIVVNLLDMRHGLLPNAPHLLLALVGLFYVWRDGDAAGRIVLALLAAYFCTMLWANGSEAYAARNWMAAMPFVAYGLARWLAAPGTREKFLALPFFLLSFCLLCVLVRWPNAFLDSRNAPVPYEKLFTLLPHLHLGYLLPYDFLDHEGAGLNASLGRGLGVAAVLGCFAAGQILAARLRRAWPGATLQVLALATILFFSLVEKVPDVAVSLTREGDDAFFLNCALPAPTELAFLHIANPDAAMKPYGFFTMGLVEARGMAARRVRASTVTPLPPFTPIAALLVAERAPRPDKRWLDSAAGAALYRRVLSLPGL